MQTNVNIKFTSQLYWFLNQKRSIWVRFDAFSYFVHVQDKTFLIYAQKCIILKSTKGLHTFNIKIRLLSNWLIFEYLIKESVIHREVYENILG